MHNNSVEVNVNGVVIAACCWLHLVAGRLRIASRDLRDFLASRVHRPAARMNERRGQKATARGFEPLRAEHNGFLVHHLNHSVTLSLVSLLS